MFSCFPCVEVVGARQRRGDCAGRAERPRRPTALGRARALDGEKVPLPYPRLRGRLEAWDDARGYGWIRPNEPIDHPAARGRRGRIFLSARDSAGPPRPGAAVSFELYLDSRGLGAERCQAEADSAGAWEPPAAELRVLTVRRVRARGFRMEEVLGWFQSQQGFLGARTDGEHDAVWVRFEAAWCASRALERGQEHHLGLEWVLRSLGD